jgi:hypothetical protein
MRGVAALVGTLTVPVLYALGRELERGNDRPLTGIFDIPPALPWLAALALATMRWHVHFSRVGIEPVLVPLLLVLILWALFRALRTNGPAAWIALGVFTGLGPYAYPAGRLLPVVVVGLAVWALLRRQGDKETRKQGGRGLRPVACGLLLAGIVALVVVAPLAWNWLQHPDQLLLRSGQIATGAGGAPTGSKVTAFGVTDNLLAALGMFSLRGDGDLRNNVPGLPVLDPLMSVPFYLGLLLTLWRWKRPAGGGLLLAGLIMLVPTVLSEYAPHFRRALGAAPVVALLCGTGLAAIWDWSRRPPMGRLQMLRPGSAQVADCRCFDRAQHKLQIAPFATRYSLLVTRYLVRAIAAVVLLGSAVLSANAYFGRWSRDAGLYYAYDQGLWEIGQYVLGLPADELVYVTPRPASDMTLAFAWREGRSVRHFDGRSAFVAPVYAPGPATYIVIEHEDFRGGRLLWELYPQATEVKTFLDRGGRVYARAYQIPPGLAAGTGNTPIPNTQVPTLGRQPEFAVTGGWPGIELIGYDLDKPAYRSGEIVYLQLWWHATAPAPADWTVFTHLLGPARADGSVVWAGQDARPGQGSAPTTTWAPGDLILDEYQLQLPADAPPGEYQIEIGLYDPAAGGVRAITSDPPGMDHLILGTVRVEASGGP